MSAEHFTAPESCADCPHVKTWLLRIDSLEQEAANATSLVDEVFAGEQLDTEEYMRQVDAEQNYAIAQGKVALACMAELVDDCPGPSQAPTVLDLRKKGDPLPEPFIFDQHVCGVSLQEWNSINAQLLELPTPDEDQE